MSSLPDSTPAQGAPYSAPTYFLPAALIDACEGDPAQALLLQRFHDWGAADDWLTASMTDLVRMTHMHPAHILVAVECAEQAGRLETRVAMAPCRGYRLVVAP